MLAIRVEYEMLISTGADIEDANLLARLSCLFRPELFSELSLDLAVEAIWPT